MAIKTLLVDDEKLALSRLRRLLKGYEEIEICAEARNGKEALTLVDQHQPDLIFLDIRMPLLSGFEMLKALEQSPYIIFTTAFNEYALQAFEENTVDYLLKPISEEKLARAVEKVQRMVKQPTQGPDLEKLVSLIHEREQQIHRFSARVGDRVTLIPEESVLYFKAEEKYTFLYSVHETTIVSYTLKELENRLNRNRFLRVHRNAIINLDRVQSIEKWFGGKWRIKFENGEYVVVSTHYAAAFKERIGL
jgi:DNA-binding LytR/AlgR family response regulator